MDLIVRTYVHTYIHTFKRRTIHHSHTIRVEFVIRISGQHRTRVRTLTLLQEFVVDVLQVSVDGFLLVVALLVALRRVHGGAVYTIYIW